MGGSCPWQQLPGAKLPGLDGCSTTAAPPGLLSIPSPATHSIRCHRCHSICWRTGAKQLPPAGGAPLIWEPGPISGVVSCGPGWLVGGGRWHPGPGEEKTDHAAPTPHHSPHSPVLPGAGEFWRQNSAVMAVPSAAGREPCATGAVVASNTDGICSTNY